MTNPNPRGLIAVDKMGGKVLFLDPASYETTIALDDFERVPHELPIVEETQTAYVPIFGNGIHGRNPKPGHLLSVIDLASRTHAGDIDLTPYIAPHGLQLGPDGLLYVTCENSGVVAIVDRARRAVVGAIETASTNAHRLAIAPDGRTLFTENEEDASISVIQRACRHGDAARPAVRPPDHTASRQAADGCGLSRRPSVRRLPGRRQRPRHRRRRAARGARLRGGHRLRDAGIFLIFNAGDRSIFKIDAMTNQDCRDGTAAGILLCCCK